MEFVNIEVRKMTIEDLPSVLEIENLSFVDKWKKENFLYELNENKISTAWVVELSSEERHIKSIVGFTIFWEMFDRVSICQIAVHPEIRRRSMGTALMNEIYNECYAKKISKITLEVRKSNQNAILFYENQGFKQIGMKEKYYPNNEDAILMELEVKL